ncbi:MAG: class I SAM-dependent methyltransferase [Alphaproteobacteria bacterium]|nr:class I SAM-dependent methyltransferase [Alphaproteobacteria bacterium]
MNAAPDREAHRRFLNRFYGVSRWFYDLTRRYYLIGREAALQELAATPWQRLVEIGPGTGRNLRKLRAARPDAELGGVEASDAMLEYAGQRCPGARLVAGFAEDFDLPSVLGGRPDVVLFSYCLSMVQDPDAALQNARRSLAPGGRVMVVDFADLAGVPAPGDAALRRWLEAFHVEPVDLELLAQHGARLRFGRGRYWVLATMGPLEA